LNLFWEADMDIRPIRNDADHTAALKEIESLWDAAKGTLEADRMEVLAIVLEEYENKRWPFPQYTPLEILNYAVNEMGRSQSELAELLGSRSRASELLSGKRPLTLEAVRKISAAWNIPAQLLIAPNPEKAVV
jgi:HTH-type transcriptional regulator / antitoxin HigA